MQKYYNLNIFFSVSRSVVNDLVHKEKNVDVTSTSLLPELTQYLQWSGLYEPLQKIYIQTRSLDMPYVGHLLFVFVAANLQKFTYSKALASLVARRTQDAVDGTPFIVGTATLLRHVGPSSIQTCCSLLIQYARSHLEFCAG